MQSNILKNDSRIIYLIILKYDKNKSFLIRQYRSKLIINI